MFIYFNHCVEARSRFGPTGYSHQKYGQSGIIDRLACRTNSLQCSWDTLKLYLLLTPLPALLGVADAVGVSMILKRHSSPLESQKGHFNILMIVVGPSANTTISLYVDRSTPMQRQGGTYVLPGYPREELCTPPHDRF